jgi:hypothetical protein
MAVIQRLIDFMPVMTGTSGGMVMLVGSVGMGAGLMLASWPMYAGSVLLWLVGWGGPTLSAKKRETMLTQQKSPPEDADEDAAGAS